MTAMNAPATTRVLINTTGWGILLSGEAEQWLKDNGYDREAVASTGRRLADDWENHLPEGVRAVGADEGDDEGDDDDGFGVEPSRVATEAEQQAAMSSWVDAIEPTSWDTWRHSPALLACFDALGTAMTPVPGEFPGGAAPVDGWQYEFGTVPPQSLATVTVAGPYYMVRMNYPLEAGERVEVPTDEEAGWQPTSDWDESYQAHGLLWVNIATAVNDLEGGALLSTFRNPLLVLLAPAAPGEHAGLLADDFGIRGSHP
jgi:hypothetical protein